MISDKKGIHSFNIRSYFMYTNTQRSQVVTVDALQPFVCGPELDSFSCCSLGGQTQTELRAVRGSYTFLSLCLSEKDRELYGLGKVIALRPRHERNCCIAIGMGSPAGYFTISGPLNASTDAFEQQKIR